MHSPAAQPDWPWARHRLVRIDPPAWATLLASRSDLAAEPLLVDWAARGWPLVVRRRAPGDGDGLALGLPLPPCAGKRRIALTLAADAVVSAAPMPPLGDVIQAAPRAWWPTLRALQSSAARHDVRPRVFGSLAWQTLTGLVYLGADSDLDILWTLPRPARLGLFLDELAAIAARAPMRLDGELVRPDGAGVNWRELRDGGAELLVKTRCAPLLARRDAFLQACA